VPNFNQRKAVLQDYLSKHNIPFQPHETKKQLYEKIKLDEWILKSTSEKAAVLSKIEEDLEGLSIQKAKAKENLENIIKD
jgi:arsenate reductase-like glutaredoxin family protein